VILVDTSVWVDHFRSGNHDLAELLDAGRVLMHPFVIGELALGELHPRAITLDALANLPRVIVATDEEVLRLIEERRLFARGIGYIDVHLLAAVELTTGAELWTYDKRYDAPASIWQSR
jgi:predicted nucleic acid-binding protein